jgi:hypothetical protein
LYCIRGTCIAANGILDSNTTVAPGLHGNISHEHILQLMLRHENTAEILAKYASVLVVYESEEMYVVHQAAYEDDPIQDSVQHLPILDKML